MKIVDVCAFYAPGGGGVRTYVERKLQAAPRLGHEITVIAPGETHAVEARGPGARLVYLPAPRFPLDRAYRYFDDEAALHAALDAERPDVIEASSPWRSAESVMRWRGDAVRALVMHSDPLAAYPYRWFGRVASRNVIDRRFAWYWRRLKRLDAGFDLVVSASDSLSSRLRAGGLHGVETIPMGVEPGVFSPALRDETLRAGLLARCGLPDSAALLVAIGRFAPEKRWPLIVDAVTAAGCERPVALVIAGAGRGEAALRRHVGENPHVHLLAPIRDRTALATLLASADALVHGCEAETFCMAAAEARAAGLPIVAPDDGGAADQVRTGSGELYAATDPADATRAILDLLQRLTSARAQAVADAAAVHTMDAHFAALFARYAGLADRRQANIRAA